MYPNIYSIIYNSQAMEAKGPTKDEWLKKKWCIYTTEYYSAIKKNENFAICSNMDTSGGYYAE